MTQLEDFPFLEVKDPHLHIHFHLPCNTLRMLIATSCSNVQNLGHVHGLSRFVTDLLFFNLCLLNMTWDHGRPTEPDRIEAMLLLGSCSTVWPLTPDSDVLAFRRRGRKRGLSVHRASFGGLSAKDVILSAKEPGSRSACSCRYRSFCESLSCLFFQWLPHGTRS